VRFRSVLALVACGALLGLSYVLVRATVPTVGPVAVTVVRTSIGGVLLVTIAAVAGQPVRWRAWRAYAALGALSAAIPFTLTSVSMLTIDAGSAAVLNTAGPMFALGLDSLARRRWPTAVGVVGLAIATAGVVVVMWARGVGFERSGLVGVGFALAGAWVFAYAGFFAARRFRTAAPLAVAAGQQLAAAILLAPVVALVPPPGPVGRTTAVALAVLGVLGGAAAYLLFYWLIQREGPVFTANVSLLIPVAGVLWGAALLGEPLTPVSLAGMVLVVAGLALVLRGTGESDGPPEAARLPTTTERRRLCRP